MRISEWLVDSSVVLRAALGDSPAAQRWFANLATSGATFAGSRLLDIEVRRVLRNLKRNPNGADDYLNEFTLISITDDIARVAAELPMKISGADTIHVATAIRLNHSAFALATHDAVMAAAASELGLKVHDPVTDDALRPPVAALN